jgi:ribonuclease HII
MSPKFDPGLLPPAPNFDFEAPIWMNGVQYVAGIDEAGRGALAGPVAVGALILPPQPALASRLLGVRDSKEMTPRQREIWAAQLRTLAVAWGVGFSSHTEIDELGISAATRLAAQRALQSLCIQPQHLLLDFFKIPGCQLPQTALVKGDARSLSIAGASILAKTERDALMRRLDQEYPGYGFAVHKGYATARHRQALERLGPSLIHRMSFTLLPGNQLEPENRL